MFALIEFAYLFVVEAGTLAYGSAMRPFWYTEWPLFKGLMFEAAVGVLLILTSVWIESAGVRVELRRPQLRRLAGATAVTDGVVKPPPKPTQKAQEKPSVTAGTCDIEWHEAS
jgi:hypothetical protein